MWTSLVVNVLLGIELWFAVQDRHVAETELKRFEFNAMQRYGRGK